MDLRGGIKVGGKLTRLLGSKDNHPQLEGQLVAGYEWCSVVYTRSIPFTSSAMMWTTASLMESVFVKFVERAAHMLEAQRDQNPGEVA